MQKTYIGLIIWFLVLVVSSSGCISIGRLVNNSNNGNSTYSGNGVSFNYPSNWQLSQNTATWPTFSVAVFRYNSMNSPGFGFI